MVIENPRYANYARAHGRSPEAQLEEDRRNWPGGMMVGFTQWNQDRIDEAKSAIPEAFYLGNLTNHAAYDAWLDAWVDQHGVMQPSDAEQD